ncbi:MAG: hypothetical protein PHQ23_07935, partial [Candidatus Wallbacteria bacterium]|nr:hypothetical protein [Candidatus Wallbacteria bacterium]
MNIHPSHLGTIFSILIFYAVECAAFPAGTVFSDFLYPNPGWDSQVQVYTVERLSAQQDAAYWLTVNGLLSPLDSRFIQSAHKSGRLAGACLSLLTGDDSIFREAHRRYGLDLRDAVTRSLSGKRAVLPWFAWRSGSQALSLNHPAFRKYLSLAVRDAVDAGADFLVLDHIECLDYLLPDNSGGYADCDVEAFYSHLAEEGFDSFASWLCHRYSACWSDEVICEKFNLRKADNFGIVHLLRTSSSELEQLRQNVRREYCRFHEDYIFREVRALINETRAYADQKNKPIKIWINHAGMGGKFRLGPLFSNCWSGIADRMISEIAYAFPDRPDAALFPPIASLAPFHKLGLAYGTRPVVLMPDPTWGEIASCGDRGRTLSRVLFSEAFACRGFWAIGSRGKSASGILPDLEPYARFVRENRWLYETELDQNNLAVLFSNQALLDEPGAFHSFLGTAHFLHETSMQYDVVYLGDDRFGGPVPDREIFNRYYEMIVPFQSISEVLYEELARFAASGKKLIIYGNPGGRLQAFHNVRCRDNLGLRFMGKQREQSRKLISEAFSFLSRQVREIDPEKVVAVL